MFLFLQVDCTANSNTCNKYGVSGYPTLKIFRDGEEAGTYDGPRTAGMSSSASIWLAKMVAEGRPICNRLVSGMLHLLKDTKKVLTYTHTPTLPFPELIVLAEPWMFIIP